MNLEREVRMREQTLASSYRVVGGKATVDEVERPLRAILVDRLKVVRREDGGRRRRADRNVREECVFRRPVLQLITKLGR
jgi:hypothetical protein